MLVDVNYLLHVTTSSKYEIITPSGSIIYHTIQTREDNMGYGVELTFGYRLKDWHKISGFIDQIFIKDGLIQSGFDWIKFSESLANNAYGPEADFLEQLTYNSSFDSGVHDGCQIRSDELIKAHALACQDMGWTQSSQNEYKVLYNTPVGIRELRPWQLDLIYDSDESGHCPEDATIGVYVTGKYGKVFLDWNDHNNGTSPIVFSPNQKELIIAQRRIIEAMPEFADATFNVVFKHY